MAHTLLAGEELDEVVVMFDEPQDDLEVFKVEDLLPEAKTVTLDDGETLDHDKLVLCLGARHPVHWTFPART